MTMLRELSKDNVRFEATSAADARVKPGHELMLLAGKYRFESRLKVGASGSAGIVESCHAYHIDVASHVLEIDTLCPEQ